ncbi:MAG: glycosyltransferase family 2 protein [Methanobacterium sp.]|jgi:glycosyltransferase involved in cell wall biosynthesis
MSDLSFIIPAYNEEESIGLLVNNIITKYPNSKISVIDNNSSDKTAEIASKLGVEVIFEKKQGKACAMRTGFNLANSKYVVMLDADNTYDPNDAERLVEPLRNGEVDLVLGSRLRGNKEEGSISIINVIGNHILSLIASIFFHPVSDVCTGYWAFNDKLVDYICEVGLDCSGFEMEAEMFAKISKSKFKITEIPISYKKRTDETKLKSFSDGFKIFRTLLKHKITPVKKLEIQNNLKPKKYYNKDFS